MNIFIIISLGIGMIALLVSMLYYSSDRTITKVDVK
jgi:hypothetical protein